MANSIIYISLDVSVKSVGSSFLRVILIGSISVEVLVVPKVGVAAVASSTGVLELDTHSSSEVDPLEKSDTEIPKRYVSPTTSILETPTAPILPAPSAIVAPLSEFSLAPVVAPLGIRRRRAILIRPGEDIPIDHSTSGSSSSHSSSDRSLSRSPAATVISPVFFARALVHSRADILPPHKRFRDFISPEDSVEDDIDTDVLKDIEADATAVEVAVDRDVETRIDGGIDMEVDVGIDVEDELKSSDRGTMEVRVDIDVRIDIPDGMLMPDAMEHLEQRQLEAGQLIAIGERASLSDRTRSLEQENLKVRALLCIERDQVDSLRRHMALSQEEFRQVRMDRDDTRRRLRRLELFVERRLGFCS
nr:hypothetical protein [Tanacetum cinerariifolium]